jgi:hypothetical protein
LRLCFFFSSLILYTAGRTTWTEDQPFARSLPIYRRPQTQNKRTLFLHSCLEWDSNLDPSVGASEGSSCLRLRGHCERRYYNYGYINTCHQASSMGENRKNILPRVLVNKTRVWIGESIYWIFISRNCK